MSGESKWINADGSEGQILPATTMSAAVPEDNEPDPGPSQEFLQALVAAEQDRLRSEGWRACVEHLQREYHQVADRYPDKVPYVLLDGEQLWFLANRLNPFRAAPSLHCVKGHCITNSTCSLHTQGARICDCPSLSDAAPTQPSKGEL